MSRARSASICGTRCRSRSSSPCVLCRCGAMTGNVVLAQSVLLAYSTGRVADVCRGGTGRGAGFQERTPEGVASLGRCMSTEASRPGRRRPARGHRPVAPGRIDRAGAESRQRSLVMRAWIRSKIIGPRGSRSGRGGSCEGDRALPSRDECLDRCRHRTMIRALPRARPTRTGRAADQARR